MANDETCELLALDAARAEEIRRNLPDFEALERAADQVKALSDPTRLMLAVALRDGGELCVCDCAFLAGRQDKLVSHHLRQLRAAGLVRSRKDGRMVLYRLTATGKGLLKTVLSAAPVAEPAR